MYSQEFGFHPSDTAQKHAREREELAKTMKASRTEPHEKNRDTHDLQSILPAALTDGKLGSEDIVLIALIIFLLSDSTKNDLLLVGVLIYLLLF